METVTLRPLYHREKDCIGIYFNNLPLLNKSVRKVTDCRWTKTFKCWYTPLNKANYMAITAAFEGLAVTDFAELKTYLIQRQKVTPAVSPAKVALPPAPVSGVKEKTTTTIYKPLTVIKAGTIQAINAHVLPAMKQQLVLKAYSPSTIRTYLTEMSQLLQTVGKNNADALTPVDLRRYLVFCFEKLRLAENTLHSRINALKFYYEQVLGREKFFWEIPRPKKHIQLPQVFNQDEVAGIINSITNLKHKTMLMLAYSAGLRVSEVVALKTYQVDSKRMSIFLERAKGKKDRLVALSAVLLVMLREYALKYKPQKKGYLFEGAVAGQAYSTRSLEEVIQQAKQKAGVIKPGSIHALRHSFATHLLERGTDISMIQKLLGHNDLRTTLRYLHTTNKDLIKIVSPLDNLDLK
ncbi:tyrosine-type recombinase/integrase [Ferruginibacter sp.]|uniref:tyrosine-type recombinase/integrase n=1 Tax=Ferruginibacter sp. TaxID=1940288 RepID=UPI002658EA2A|nr:tyrosine-type recombinase/integrase [Ferruginibacter sp.]